MPDQHVERLAAAASAIQAVFMTKKHDEKVAAEEHDAEIAKRKEDEKRLKKTAKKLATVSRLQVLSHALEPKK